jgi:hypothetical protein
MINLKGKPMKTISKLWTAILIASLLCVNLLIAQPAWADAGKFVSSPDYQAITTQIDALLQAQTNPATKVTPSELQQKLVSLQTLKYILETASQRASCLNLTGHTLGVYLKSKKATADAPSLYYLADGKATDDDFTCTGVYLPASTNVAFSLGEPANSLREPSYLRIVEGTQWILKANPETGAVEVNLPPLDVLTASSGVELPSLTQVDIDAQITNAPAD